MKNYTSRMVIEILDDNGNRVKPDNRLVDECRGLTLQQAAAHHYALKAAYGKIVANVNSEDMRAFTNAVNL